MLCQPGLPPGFKLELIKNTPIENQLFGGEKIDVFRFKINIFNSEAQVSKISSGHSCRGKGCLYLMSLPSLDQIKTFFRGGS